MQHRFLPPLALRGAALLLTLLALATLTAGTAFAQSQARAGSLPPMNWQDPCPYTAPLGNPGYPADPVSVQLRQVTQSVDVLAVSVDPCTLEYLTSGGDPSLVPVQASGTQDSGAPILGAVLQGVLQSAAPSLRLYLALYAQSLLSSDGACPQPQLGISLLVAPSDLQAAAVAELFPQAPPQNFPGTTRCGLGSL
jgi:hypothetical protein